MCIPGLLNVQIFTFIASVAAMSVTVMSLGLITSIFPPSPYKMIAAVIISEILYGISQHNFDSARVQAPQIGDSLPSLTRFTKSVANNLPAVRLVKGACNMFSNVK